MSRVFANGPEDRGSIPGRVLPKTQKKILDAALLSTLHYKVNIKGKVEQSKERSSAPPLHLGVILFTNPSARAGYDTRSIFKRSFGGLNSEFSFS